MDGRHNPNSYRKKIIDGSSIRNDKLFRNDFDETKGHPVFTDVSKEAGILIEGFSLGLNIVDINQDGWKDIFVSNDYLSNDLFYINNGDGTFTDKAAEYFKHTCHSAMGNDVVDLNNDGMMDVVVVDMLPEDNFRRKTMLPANNYNVYLNNENYGYQYQYVRNTLQLNQGARPDNGDLIFSEIAMLSNISSTDWSWAPLIADFDNDSDRDIIVTNGFPKDVTDHDFIEYSSDKGSFVTKKQLLKKIPSAKITNYAFKNLTSETSGNIPVFENVNDEWGSLKPSFSNGAVYADLDNDGDLDYIVNNINDSAFVYQNLLIEKKSENANYLKIKFLGSQNNKNGLGAKVEIQYGDNKKQVWENTPYRGYLSSVEGGAHFGLGKTNSIKKLIVTWQEGKKQVLENVAANQVLEVKFDDAKPYSINENELVDFSLFREVTAALGINYVHKEEDFVDFNVQRLLPHKLSQYGPGISVIDANKDGLDDFFVGGSHFYKGKFFIQQFDGTFEMEDLLPGEEIGMRKMEEDLGSLFFDADNDGDQDLYIVSGGNEYLVGDTVYQDRLYINDNGNYRLSKNSLPAFTSSGSCVKSADFDRDGDLDLFVGGRILPDEYPKPVSSYLLINDGSGNFTIGNTEIAPSLDSVGLVCDALWTDFDNDGWTDLILAGEWMPISFLKNNSGTLEPLFDAIKTPSTGWWNSLAGADFDRDGDIDYIGGNLGINTLLKASETQPIGIYAADFDDNKGLDALPSAWFPNKEGVPTEYPFFNRSDIEKQLVKLKRVYLRHYQYGETTMEEVLGNFPEVEVYTLKANQLKTSYIENLGNGEFVVKELPLEAQLAPVFGIITGDFNGDAFQDVLLSGNDFGTEVSMGRYDALNGLLLLGDGKGNFTSRSMQESGIVIPNDAKGFAQLKAADGSQLIVAGQNKGPLKVFKRENNLGKSVALEAFDASANIELDNGIHYKEEFYYGEGFLSQSARRLWVPENVKQVEVVDFQGNKRIINEFENVSAQQTSALK